MFRGDSASLSPRNVWRTIQCNGVRTVGTIARRSLQFMWQKIFTEDCHDDCQTTSKCHKQKTKKNNLKHLQTRTTILYNFLILIHISLFYYLFSSFFLVTPKIHLEPINNNHNFYNTYCFSASFFEVGQASNTFRYANKCKLIIVYVCSCV